MDAGNAGVAFGGLGAAADGFGVDDAEVLGEADGPRGEHDPRSNDRRGDEQAEDGAQGRERGENAGG